MLPDLLKVLPKQLQEDLTGPRNVQSAQDLCCLSGAGNSPAASMSMPQKNLQKSLKKDTFEKSEDILFPLWFMMSQLQQPGHSPVLH